MLRVTREGLRELGTELWQVEESSGHFLEKLSERNNKKTSNWFLDQGSSTDYAHGRTSYMNAMTEKRGIYKSIARYNPKWKETIRSKITIDYHDDQKLLACEDFSGTRLREYRVRESRHPCFLIGIQNHAEYHHKPFMART
ncbi:MAG TPA: hypothetical protein VK487_03915 [Candidatus Bathyarchaeia archaeon]|nr:hypothetical protein [Candidatus Bathyarchaeia archaeon]